MEWNYSTISNIVGDLYLKSQMEIAKISAKYERRIAELEQRIRELEEKGGPPQEGTVS